MGMSSNLEFKYMIESGVIFALVRDNKILMQQRDENCKKFPFMWCLPGGGSDDGEDYQATLLREAKEEYGIDLQLDQCSHVADHFDGNDPLRVYICQINSDQEPVMNEGMAMKWMTIEEIENTKLGFNQERIIPSVKLAME
jgi:8-oxo-dGTP pyrophosphatase MutT (NUDIX family)